MDALRKCQFINDRTDGSAESANRFRPKENLIPVKAFRAFDRRRHDRMQRHARIRFFADSAVDRFSRKFRQPLMFGANINHEQMKKRRIITSLAKLNFLLPESLKIVMACELDRW